MKKIAILLFVITFNSCRCGATRDNIGQNRLNREDAMDLLEEAGAVEPRRAHQNQRHPLLINQRNGVPYFNNRDEVGPIPEDVRWMYFVPAGLGLAFVGFLTWVIVDQLLEEGSNFTSN